MSARRAVVAIATVAVLLTATACEQRGTSLGNGWRQSVITFDDDPATRYQHRMSGGEITVSAPRSNRGGNLREALIRERTAVSVDQESCVTWHGPVADTFIQPGVVLRVRSEDFRTRGIMVTNNVWGHVRSAVNVHLIDSEWPENIRRVDGWMTNSVGGKHPLPWRFCAQAEGSVIRAKGWSMSNPEPAWTDSGAVVTVAVPNDFVYAGKPGVYMGHLQAGETTRLTNHTTRPLDGPGGRWWSSIRGWAQRLHEVLWSAAGGWGPSALSSTSLDAIAAEATWNVGGAGLVYAFSPVGRRASSRIVFGRVLGRPGATGATLLGDELAAHYASSAEFRRLSPDGPTFVRLLYERILGRTPSAGEVQGWVRQATGSGGRRTVAKAIWRSKENQRRTARELFELVYDRRPSEAELKQAAAQFRANSFDPALTMAAFVASEAPTRPSF